MSGYTKHICENETTKTDSDLNKFLVSITPLLPYEYDSVVIKDLLYKYYPYEMFLIDEKYTYYCAKEKSLISKGKKPRYNFKSLIHMMESSKKYKELISHKFKVHYQKNFNKSEYLENISAFSAKRDPKIKKIVDKIEKAKLKTQQVEPEFLDSLMGLYDKKNTSQKDKIYIIKELEKYYCVKVIRFFSKKVDTEYNRQLREISCAHLQSLGFQPMLRKQKYMRIPSKNKKRRDFLKNIYAKEHFNIKEIPQELEYRIENSKEQKLKSFDFFISHNSKDHDAVQTLIKHLNNNGKNIYCDWINDNNYLKRHLVGDATLNVIIQRLQQSKELIFILSDNSIKSSWCKYELNDFYQQQKNIYFINKEDITRGIFDYHKYQCTWFLDPLYKEITLFEVKT